VLRVRWCSASFYILEAHRDGDIVERQAQSDGLQGLKGELGDVVSDSGCGANQ